MKIGLAYKSDWVIKKATLYIYIYMGIYVCIYIYALYILLYRI